MASNLLTVVQELAPDIAAAADQAERERRMSDELAFLFSESGLFRMSAPVGYGGRGLELSKQLEVIEAVARIDGSAGWCVMIASTTSVLAGHLSDAVLGEVFGDDPLASACGVYAPKGSAVRVNDGFRVTGRWSFASGCQHSDWFLGGAMVSEGEKPQMRLMLLRTKEAMIQDTWHVSGLRGTGSHDLEVRDVFVPEGRAVDPQLGTPRREGLLYRLPLFGFLAAEVAAVTLGIARASLDAFTDLASIKVPMGARRTLAERGTIQAVVAEAEGDYGAGRTLLHQTVRDCEERLESGRQLSLPDRVSLRIASNYAVKASVRAVDASYRAAGSTSIYDVSPLQRQFRDVHTATQHAMVGMAIDELCGRALLGRDVLGLPL